MLCDLFDLYLAMTEILGVRNSTIEVHADAILLRWEEEIHRRVVDAVLVPYNIQISAADVILVITEATAVRRRVPRPFRWSAKA